MKTYQFESVVQGNGTILLPTFLNNLKNHRVKFIVIDLEQPQKKPVDRLREITRQYINLDELDIETIGIYQQRKQDYDREIVFD